MSGICGIVFHGKPERIERNHLLPMVHALGGRANGEGWCIGKGPAGLGAHPFGARMAGGAEAAAQGKPLALAFHGSLYRLKDLCPAGPGGVDPYTVLLNLYLQSGMAFVQKLLGEFSLAVWDGRDETLYLTTDRFRVHPLFYYQDRDKLIFASRMKSLLACPFPVDRTINVEGLLDVLGSSVIPTPKTIYQDVRKLPAGHILTCRRGETSVASYWDINFLQTDDAPEAELAHKLTSIFSEAVACRLEADGGGDRIGTFLSGGVDSSTITGVVTQLTGRPVKSFSIGFGEQRFNEISYARLAARAFNAEHYEYFVTPQDTYDAIPVLMEAFDEPFANASAVPTYFCARLAREHGVDILYAGDGGDELFAGNERYATQGLFEYYHRIPAWLREPVLKPLVFALAEGLKLNLFIKGKKYIQRAGIPYVERLSSYGFFKIVPIADVLSDDLMRACGTAYDPSALSRAYYAQAPARTNLDRHLYIDLKNAIMDNDLLKVTRMTEAAGVTVRFPFLDHRVAEFAATVPAHVKMRGRNLRSFFKHAYADLLPAETRAKTKHGFGLPIPVWLRTDTRLNEMMRDLVLSPATVQRGHFRKKALEELVARHQTDETSFYGTALWNLMMLELWLRQK